MPTSPAPWHPDTSITEKAIYSLWSVIGEVPIHIYADAPAEWCTEEDIGKYNAYIDALRGLDLGPIFEADQHMGLVGLLRVFLADFDKQIIINMQHDWEILSPRRIESHRIAFLMDSRPKEIQCIRFHKRTLPQPEGNVDREYYETTDYAVPLIRTDGWGDSPHFATRYHYHTHVVPYLDDACGNDGRYGVEGPVVKAYRKYKKEVGFEKAQAEWGSFIYGQFGDAPYIRHLGGNSTKWREQRGAIAKR